MSEKTTMNPEEIDIHPLVSKLFPIQETMLATITASMAESSYDFSQPVIVAYLKGSKIPICVDGHTRIQAAKNAGITSLPVFVHEDLSEEEAICLAIRLQRDRRNMTDADLMACVEALDEKRAVGRPKKELSPDGDHLSRDHAGKGNEKSQGLDAGKRSRRSAKVLADELGASERKVERARAVAAHGAPEVIEAVKKGEMSVNQAYNETQEMRKKTSAKEPSAKRGSTAAESAEQGPQELTETNELSRKAMAEQVSPAGNLDGENRIVRVSNEHFDALARLDGSVEDHVARAINRYLESLALEDNIMRGGGHAQDCEEVQTAIH